MYQDGDGECVQRFDHQPKQSSRDRSHSAGGDGVWSSGYKQRVIPIQRNDPDL
eukprot:CAMPEP_0202462116 /NCGR_PEP_ID=MMETSP1360-20130828/52605_1 /ASSEMBLY_ACC=CAM_ASM_000848 /TAXON_ID=515479 /ORGANISM="Licmophora paradoxa, Strain CCMP2313" /LENGTH=52 /DNA_ID=CAMNT_0049084451 /DNA_START=1 /DNA_END=156 /DNA_ORIENTATION=+